MRPVGYSLSVPGLLDALGGHGVDRGAVDYVMATHVHLGHAGGAGALLRGFPNARLLIHPHGARHMIDPAQLVAGATAVYGAEAARWPISRVRTFAVFPRMRRPAVSGDGGGALLQDRSKLAA
jgi:glyoxylase-like metal-dependent hydrolase (beta-lactamase superfamily II)